MNHEPDPVGTWLAAGFILSAVALILLLAIQL